MMSNEILWEQLRKGSQKAIEDLYRLNYQVLYSYALKISRNKDLSKDCIQEIFLQLWEKRNRLNAVSKVRPYLLQSVWHAIIQKLKMENKLLPLNENEPYELDVVFSQESVLIQDQQNKEGHLILSEAFNKLTKRQREIIFMQYYEGMTIHEIQQITGLKYQSIKNLTYRAMISLKKTINIKNRNIFLSTS